MMLEDAKGESPTQRERLYDNYDLHTGIEPESEEKTPEKEKQEPQPEFKGVKTEEEPSSEEVPEKEKQVEKPKLSKKWAGEFETPEELEKKYFEKNQAFNQIRPFIDWDKLKGSLSGQPQQPQQVQQPADKDAFFADFANRGPSVLDERVKANLQQILPTLVRNIGYMNKVEDAYADFKDDYPHLIEYDEDVGKKFWEIIGKDPKKTPKKAMREAAKYYENLHNSIKEEGKREANVLYEERKKDNIPPTGQGGKDKTGIIKPSSSDEDKPRDIDEYVLWRKKIQDQGRSRMGVFQKDRR